MDSKISSPSNFTIQQFIPTAITAAKPPVVTIVGNGFLQGQALRATNFYKYPTASSPGMEQLNNNLYYVGQPIDADSFGLYDINGLPIDGTNFTPFVNTGIGMLTLTGPDLLVQNPAPSPPPGVPPLQIPPPAVPAVI